MTEVLPLANLGWNGALEAAFEQHRAEGLVPGRVSLEHNHVYRVLTAGGESMAQAAGRIKYEATGRSVSRKMKIIARTGAGPDHPVASNCLETDYLKAIWMVME